MADILWDDIVGEKTLADGGRVGDLMQVARVHVSDAVRRNEITQAQAGEVYTAMIPSAFATATKFVMEEQLISAQIDKSVADADLAAASADREYVLTLASIDKVYGFSYTLNPDGSIDRTSLVDTADGQMDYEAQLALAETRLTNRKTL